MASSTKSFTITADAYQDISEGAGNVYFKVPFDPQYVNAIRVHIGQSLPVSSIVDYEFINPNAIRVGPNPEPRDVFKSFEGLAATDRVYVRASGFTVTLQVHRIGSGVGGSGTYTPVLTDFLNIDTASGGPCQWFRVDDRVMINGLLTIDPDTVDLPTQLNISLPFACDFTAGSQASGIAGSALGEVGRIEASTIADTLQLLFTARDVTSHTFSFAASYRLTA